MSWEFKYKRDAYKFLDKQNLLNEFKKVIAAVFNEKTLK